MPHAFYIVFFFVLGSCVGSFLNVVVWRLPRVPMVDGERVLRTFYRSWQALSYPPSHCPKCNNFLKWYDNIPVIGWLKLRGRCRFCKQPISPRYPIIESLTGGLFVLYYVCFFMLNVGPCGGWIINTAQHGVVRLPAPPMVLARDWPVYALTLCLVSGLLAASLIDAELFIIPLEIPWLTAVIGFVVHALSGRPHAPGAVATDSPMVAALTAGAAVGLIASLVLLRLKLLPTSFPQGEPMLEADREELAREIEEAKRKGREPEFGGPLPPPYTPRQIRGEMRKEMLFLLLPLVLGGLLATVTMRYPALARGWENALRHRWAAGLLGSLLGAMVGAVVVWVTRIFGTLVFGRVAMGLGDVHLMFGVGAVIGAGPATVAFFVAPFFGILMAIWMLLTGKRRELPYGPYLSLGTAFVILMYCPIADYLRPGMYAIVQVIAGVLGR